MIYCSQGGCLFPLFGAHTFGIKMFSMCRNMNANGKLMVDPHLSKLSQVSRSQTAQR